ncbi:MAG TPA: ribonuclease P protein component [Planctomycetaceae bacterium]|nr:ribonuclease P protein component [Planctomycetaceae bacterium]
MTSYPLPRSRRIRSASDFERVYNQRQRAGDQHLLIFAAANGLDLPRLGLSVSKKHGNAVRRARLKRLLREAFRLSQHDLPRGRGQGLDLILIPRENSGAGRDDYRCSLVRLARRLAQRIVPPGAAPT